MAYILVIAGHETTAHLIGNGVHALLTNPDQLALLRKEPDRLDDAVEEILRYDGPVQNTLAVRTTEPVEVGEVTIPANDTVLFTLMASNRDPQRFPEPSTFDVTRTQLGHTAFGHGVHYCLGAPLARLEARIVLSTLLRRFPSLKPATEPVILARTPSVIMNGLDALPVRLR